MLDAEGGGDGGGDEAGSACCVAPQPDRHNATAKMEVRKKVVDMGFLGMVSRTWLDIAGYLPVLSVRTLAF